jgi:hypothetical protein
MMGEIGGAPLYGESEGWEDGGIDLLRAFPGRICPKG